VRFVLKPESKTYKEIALQKYSESEGEEAQLMSEIM
jgi:hypothetical protein